MSASRWLPKLGEPWALPRGAAGGLAAAPVSSCGDSRTSDLGRGPVCGPFQTSLRASVKVSTCKKTFLNAGVIVYCLCLQTVTVIFCKKQNEIKHTHTHAQEKIGDKKKKPFDFWRSFLSPLIPCALITGLESESEIRSLWQLLRRSRTGAFPRRRGGVAATF